MKLKGIRDPKQAPGIPGIKKKRPRFNFFFKPSSPGLTNLCNQERSKYSNLKFICSGAFLRVLAQMPRKHRTPNFMALARVLHIEGETRHMPLVNG